MKTTLTPPNPLAELRDWLSESAARCRAMRWFGALFRVGVAQDIAADVARHEAKVCEKVYSSQQDDLHAVALLKAAQHPDSEGGVLITPNEAKPIERFVLRSAEKDHAATELLAI